MSKIDWTTAVIERGPDMVQQHSRHGELRRALVVVAHPAIGRQAFYRSSGTNSGMENIWLPVDGLMWMPFQECWFDKTRFTSNVPITLHRFGTRRLRGLSRHLGALKTLREPSAKSVESGNDEFWPECVRINEWIGTDYARGLNRGFAPWVPQVRV